MATIESLHTSITSLSHEELVTLVTQIRATRRTKPQAKMRRKSTPAKVKRTKSRRASPKQHDIFSMAQGMTQEQKNNLAAALLKDLMK